MTPDVGKRAPFELLAFTAAPGAGELVIVELEGRFVGQDGRFTRPPVLVVEADDGRPRLELAPTRVTRDDGRWHGVYAIPAEAMPGARLALGVRGTLLELPAPDDADDTSRLATLAREANALRRALEAAEAEAATARAEADEVRAELATAVLAARDGALAESAASHEQVLAEVTARAEAAEARATDAEARATDAEAHATDAEARAIDAEARVRVAEKATRKAEAGTKVLRAELAEARDRPHAVAADAPDVTAVRRPAAQSVRHMPTVGPTTPTATHTTKPRGPGAWVAVAALVLFAVVLLGLLFGLLG